MANQISGSKFVVKIPRKKLIREDVNYESSKHAKSSRESAANLVIDLVTRDVQIASRRGNESAISFSDRRGSFNRRSEVSREKNVKTVNVIARDFKPIVSQFPRYNGQRSTRMVNVRRSYIRKRKKDVK